MELALRAMGSLLPKLGELLKEEYGLQRGVKKKIRTLSRELEAAHAVLREIRDMPPDQLNELVKLWARDVREASYDMEDTIDAFLIHVVGGPEPTTDPHMLRRMRRKVGALFKKSKARRNISSQIQEIYKKLEELTARRDRFKTADLVVNTKPATTIDSRIMNLYKTAKQLVGIEGPKDKLIDMLSLEDDGGVVPDNKKMKVVSVVGFGGLGKTTLAKAVYDQLKPHFKLGAFVPVGRNPDKKKVLRDILIGLDKEKFLDMNMMMLDEKQLMDELNEFVKEKRYLIVIDDIWDKVSWELIRSALQGSDCGSRLVITTRISEVATYAGEAYKMQPLSHDNSKKLFNARIVDGEGKYFDSPTAEACEKVLKKCDGVPLAIITIASLLASKPREDWSEVYNSIGFGHKGNDHVHNTRRILSFSYYDLPSHLKSCLLYLSIFPEDHVIEKNSLIWMWMAEGFISEEEANEEGIGLFELGERFFNELINRNMIQAHGRKYTGYIDACSVHDMVLDLIHQLSNEENFLTVLNGGERQKPQGSISRRLALHCVEEHNVGQLTNAAVEKVRSIFASECDFCALCPRLPFLRVVQMVRCSVSQDCHKDVLDHLGSLLHLRYLRVERFSITKLPREVRHLRFLQTLDLQNCRIEELPEKIGLLTQLVCLRLSPYGVTRVPTGLISKLTSLQELYDVWCDDEGSTMQFVMELGLLKELRVLKATLDVWSESNESSLLDSLGHLHHIKELEIQRTAYEDSDWVNHDARWVSCRHLRFLHLEYCLVFSRLPAWINSSLAPNLSYLHVNVAAVKDQDMETLAKLPELCGLILHTTGRDTKSVVRIKICTHEGVGYFRKLRLLEIDGSSIWFDVCGSECSSSKVPSFDTMMPSLESLVFEVHVRSLKDENLRLGFDKMLSFENIGTSSLQIVKAHVNCEGAGPREVEEAEAALKHAAAVHPKHPTLKSYRVNEQDMISRYQEACMEMSRAPELVFNAWKLADIVGSEDIQIMCVSGPEASSSKVIRLLYTDNGVALLALSSNAVRMLFKCEHSAKNPNDKPSKFFQPVLWQLENGIPMTNHTTYGNNPEEATACTALSRDDKYLISASGGKVSLFYMEIFQVRPVFMAPLAVTFLAFHPNDINIVAIGWEDSSIHILNYITNTVEAVLTGHQKKITGLAFSKSMELLVSSGADAQLCVWSIDAWKKKEPCYIKSRYIKHRSNGSSAFVGDTMVQFHYDEMHLLVVHESQLAIYDWQLECLCSWYPTDPLPAPISSAVYSLGCLMVYAGFRDGAIGIFEAESFTSRCRIAPSAYIPYSIPNNDEIVYPTAVATHPSEPRQIAVGMSDGAVLVLEPLDTDDVQVGSNTDKEQCPTSDVCSCGDHSQVLDA